MSDGDESAFARLKERVDFVEVKLGRFVWVEASGEETSRQEGSGFEAKLMFGLFGDLDCVSEVLSSRPLESVLKGLDLSLVSTLSLVEGPLIKEVGGALEDSLNDLKVLATEELERVATDLGEAAKNAGMPTDLFGKAASLAAPFEDLVKEACRGVFARSTSEAWRVREVAVLAGFKAVRAIRASERRDETSRLLEADLLRALLRRRALELSPFVKTALREGDKLAESGVALAKRILSTAVTTQSEYDDLDDEEEEAALALSAAWAVTEASVQAELEADLLAIEEEEAKIREEPDLLQKQISMVRCRELQRKVASASANVKDIGTALSVVVRMVGQINSRLDDVSAKLDATQLALRGIRDELRKLTGKPVLEVFDDVKNEVKKRLEKLPHKVYIPMEGQAGPVPGNEAAFSADAQDNPPFDLLYGSFTMEARFGDLIQKIGGAKFRAGGGVADFLKCADKQILLLAGAAGSGKSTRANQRLVS